MTLPSPEGLVGLRIINHCKTNPQNPDATVSGCQSLREHRDEPDSVHQWHPTADEASLKMFMLGDSNV